MDRIKALYEVLKNSAPGKLKTAIRRGDLSNCLNSELDSFSDEVCQQVLAYGRDVEASKMTPPYLLSDFLCYIYADDARFAIEYNVNAEYIEQAIYDGCYWHNGQILRPERPGDTSVDGFINARIDFSDKHAKCLRSSLWPAYVKWALSTGARTLDRLPFLKAVEDILSSRGHKVRRSVRVGKDVSTGYLGLSVKTV